VSSARIRPSSCLSPVAPSDRLSPFRGLPRARPPSPPTVDAAIFTRSPASASLGQADAQRLLQLHYDARTRPRAPDSRLCSRPPSRVCCGGLSRSRSLSPRFLGRDDPPPSKRDHERFASRDNPSAAGPTTLQARRRIRPRMPPLDRDAACGRRLDPTIVCGDGR